ncbi:MAG: hypothetical protein LBQ42_09670, partial [Synergistaceae bacterium]|nr:hypothetical protein [Synergistaceae bacterium]
RQPGGLIRTEILLFHDGRSNSESRETKRAEDLCEKTSGRVVYVCARSIDEFLRVSGLIAVGAVPIEERAVGGNARVW